MWGGEASRADKTTTSKPFYSSVPGIPLPLTGNPQVHFPTYPPSIPTQEDLSKEESLVEKAMGLLQVCTSMYATLPNGSSCTELGCSVKAVPVIFLSFSSVWRIHQREKRR